MNLVEHGNHAIDEVGDELSFLLKKLRIQDVAKFDGVTVETTPDNVLHEEMRMMEINVVAGEVGLQLTELRADPKERLFAVVLRRGHDNLRGRARCSSNSIWRRDESHSTRRRQRQEDHRCTSKHLPKFFHGNATQKSLQQSAGIAKLN